MIPLLLLALLSPSAGHPPAVAALVRADEDPLPTLAAPASTPEQSLRMPWVFGDGMVLPCGRGLPFRGKARPHAEVVVEFGPQRVTTAANAAGEWRVSFMGLGSSEVGASFHVEARPDPQRDADGPVERLEFTDVVVGEVWLCAGQSNMAFPLNQAEGGPELRERLAGDPGVRILDLSSTTSMSAQPWSMAQLRAVSPQSWFETPDWRSVGEGFGDFSAVGASFGARLRRELQIPIGLIDVSVGGSPTESWVPREEVRADSWLSLLEEEFPASVHGLDFLRERSSTHLRAWIEAGRPDPVPEHPFRSGFLFEAAIAPLRDFPLAGMLWYQGESNAEDVIVHDMLFRRAVDSWRRSLRNPGLSVLTVQLPAMARTSWPAFREGQARLAQREDVEMAVSIDLGSATDVHPRDKAAIGERLARLALDRIYGRSVGADGPELRRTRRRGDQLELLFRHHEGLRLDPAPTSPFWLAGEDRRFVRAEARLEDGRLHLSHPLVPTPVAVRYAWEPVPTATLFNGAGLPAAPFRSDDWEPVKVVCVGDSITAGVGTELPSRDGVVAQLDRQLGPLFEVRGDGVPGASVTRGLMRGDWDRGYASQPAHARALARWPDVVVINLGINDVLDESFDADRFVADYRALIDSFAALHTRPTILLASRLAPLFPGHALHGDPRLDAVQAALDRVVAETGLAAHDFAAELRQHPEDTTDAIHPNAKGAARMAREIVKALEAAGFPTPLEPRPR